MIKDEILVKNDSFIGLMKTTLFGFSEF